MGYFGDNNSEGISILGEVSHFFNDTFYHIEIKSTKSWRQRYSTIQVCFYLAEVVVSFHVQCSTKNDQSSSGDRKTRQVSVESI